MGLLVDNPVLAKEMRSRLRARRQSRAGRIGAFLAVGAIVVLLYYFGIVSLLTPNGGNTGDGLFSFLSIGLELTLVLFLTPSLASAAITQEREQQTWNALLLSRLTPGEIVVGKFVSALIPALIVLAVFFPLKLLAAIVGSVSLLRFVLATLLILLTICFCTAISLFWSWACRRTYIATAAAFGSIAFLVIGTVVIYGLFTIAVSVYNMDLREFPLTWVNPYVAMGVIVDNGSMDHAYVSIICDVAYLFGTMALLAIMSRRLARGPRELEQ